MPSRNTFVARIGFQLCRETVPNKGLLHSRTPSDRLNSLPALGQNVNTGIEGSHSGRAARTASVFTYC